MLKAAWMAGPYLRVTAWHSTDINSTPTIIYRVTNVGVEPMTQAGVVGIEGFESTHHSVPALGPGESAQFSLYTPPEFMSASSPRTDARFFTSYVATKSYRTVKVMNHPHQTVFSDNFEQPLSQWKNDLWGIETVPGHGRALADSPYEHYFESDIPNTLELRAPVSLKSYDAAELRFDAKLLVRGVHHRLLVEARRPSEQTWQSLTGDYLQASYQKSLTPRNELRGAHRLWETYVLSLDEFAGDDVVIRFSMETTISGSSSPVFDGALIDNLKIVGALKRPSSAHEAQQPFEPENRRLAWPNPSDDRIFVQHPEALHGNVPMNITVRIDDMLGREVLLKSGTNGLWLDIRHLPPGPYILSITSPESVLSEKILRR